MFIWLVVSTPLKNISQNGNLPQIGLKIKTIWNHHLVYHRPANIWPSIPQATAFFVEILHVRHAIARPPTKRTQLLKSHGRYVARIWGTKFGTNNCSQLVCLICESKYKQTLETLTNKPRNRPKMNTETLSPDDIDLPRMIAWCMCSRHSPTCLSFWRLQIELKLAVLQNNRKYTSQNVSTKTFWGPFKNIFFQCAQVGSPVRFNLSICQVASGMALETPLQGSWGWKRIRFLTEKVEAISISYRAFVEMSWKSFSWDGLKSLNIVEILAMVPFRVQKTVPNWWRDQLGIPHSGCALVTKLLDLRDSVGLQYQGASFRMCFPFFMGFSKKTTRDL